MNRLPVEYLAEMTKRRARGQLSVIAEETLYASLDRRRQPRMTWPYERAQLTF